MHKVYLALAAVSALALAGCDDARNKAAPVPGSDNGAAIVVQPTTPPSNTTTLQIQVPEALAPAAEAIANPQQTMDDLRARAGTMSEQMKQDAVVAARRAAEDGARALGQTESEIREAGDVAERSSRQMLGLQ